MEVGQGPNWGCRANVKKKKAKVKLSLHLINYALCHEDMWWRDSIAPPLLTLALDVNEWSASCPSHFTLWEKDAGTHWIGGWAGPRACLDTVDNRKIS
jgi:hypothetical protein